jgi:type II secretory pathway pseudopilin PulG
LPANHANKREKEFRKQESVFSVDIYSRQFACLAGSIAVTPAPSSSKGGPVRRSLGEGGFTLAKQRERISATCRAVALREGGFTLAELLVATGVTAGIVLMLGWMFGSLMSSASHANERVDAFRDARAALQMMERDLRNVVRNQWNPDPFTIPTPTPTPSPCIASPVSTTRVTLPAAYFALKSIYADPATVAGNQNQQLYALIADTTSGSPGDVCAVGYYCRWDDQLHAYTLRRFFRGSATTLGVIRTAGTYAADSVLYTPTANDPVLAAYVWNLKITLYDAAGNLYTTYPCVCDQPAANPNGATPRMLPAAVEISFNAMSPQAARTVMSVSSSPNDWMDSTTQNYQRLVQPHAYQFRSRINLP